MQLNNHNHRSLERFLAIALVLVAGVVFYVRTVGQPYFTPSDFALYYASGRAWLAGENPYDGEGALRAWVAADGNPDIMPPGFRQQYDQPWMPVIHLPTAITVFAPFALFDAPAAVLIWYLLAGSLLLAQTAALASLAGTTLLQTRGLLLLAITLLLAPVHEMFGYAQPSGPVISLIIISLWAATRQRDIFAGVLMGLAAAVKPHLVIGFFIYYAFRRRWRVTGSCITVALLAGLIAIVAMEVRDVPWTAGWLANLALAEAPGGMNSTAIDNDGRVYMLQLQVILNVFFQDARLVNGLAMAITCTIAALFAWRQYRAQRNDELLSLSIVSFLTLLPLYHRFYDAALLLVALAWAIGHVFNRPRFALPIILVVLSFMLPIAAVVRLELLLGNTANEFSAWWWHALVQPFRTWILLFGVGCTIAAIGELRRRSSDTPAPLAIRHKNREPLAPGAVA